MVLAHKQVNAIKVKMQTGKIGWLENFYIVIGKAFKWVFGSMLYAFWDWKTR